jgi:hypothetical protein
MEESRRNDAHATRGGAVPLPGFPRIGSLAPGSGVSAAQKAWRRITTIRGDPNGMNSVLRSMIGAFIVRNFTIRGRVRKPARVFAKFEARKAETSQG